MKNLIRFDSDVKRLSRNKPNFGIPEGFLSELTGDDIKIESIFDLGQGDDCFYHGTTEFEGIHMMKLLI